MVVRPALFGRIAAPNIRNRSGVTDAERRHQGETPLLGLPPAGRTGRAHRGTEGAAASSPDFDRPKPLAWSHSCEMLLPPEVLTGDDRYAYACDLVPGPDTPL